MDMESRSKQAGSVRRYRRWDVDDVGVPQASGVTQHWHCVKKPRRALHGGALVGKSG